MSIIYSRLVGMSALSALLLFNVALIPAVASFANVSVHCLTGAHSKLPLSLYPALAASPSPTLPLSAVLIMKWLQLFSAIYPAIYLSVCLA